jgi:hypothetical protein
MSAVKVGPTSVIEARIDTRVLARLAQTLSAGGIEFRSKGELVRKSLESFYSLLIENRMTLNHELISTSEALEILHQFGITRTNASGKNLASLSRTIGQERQLEMERAWLADTGLFALQPTTLEPSEDSVEDLMKELERLGFQRPEPGDPMVPTEEDIIGEDE